LKFNGFQMIPAFMLRRNIWGPFREIVMTGPAENAGETGLNGLDG
jgi:hypothetical protein